MHRIVPQMRVQNLHTGKTGTTCPDFMSCCSDDETPVVWDGTSEFVGIKTTDLGNLGPENAIPDVKRCGAGQGAECCIFIVAGPAGFECQRYGELRFTLIFKQDMSAKRQPIEPYPACMLPS